MSISVGIIGLSSSRLSFDAKSQTSTDGDQLEFVGDRLGRGGMGGQGSKAKSSLCKNFLERGSCPYGNRCQFAHGPEELRVNMEVNRSYKTKGCHAFEKRGFCCYGERCNFIHRRQAEESNRWTKIYANHRDTIRSSQQQQCSRLLQILEL